MNEQNVSKVRARKTKSREKRAGKGKTVRQPLRENPAVGLLIGFLLWACTVFIIAAELIIRRELDINGVLRLTGDAAFLLISLLASGLFLKIMQPDVLKSNKHILMLALIALISVVSGKTIYYVTAGTGFMSPQTARFLLPLAMAPLFTTILVNSSVAVAVGVWTSLVMGAMAGHSFPIVVTGIVATLVTAQMAQRVRTRSKVARTGLVIGLCEVACVFGVTALAWKQPEVMDVLNRAGACVISGFLSAIIVLLILPAFEVSFGITTDISLLELSDLGHPLLQRLAIEAPGTYHHSLVVANLAQAAADEIDAKSLLVRVASYFHDIGKLTKPAFFTENMQMPHNPHDDLPPSMSTLVITAHVKEGLSLAMLHKLPRTVRDVISQHHGTSLISYFHQKAKTQLETEPETRGSQQAVPNAKVDDAAFRYSGPRPASRESAIICLADAVEAASRGLEKTTPAHIEGVVEDITRARVADGQLDNSGLTLSELARIKRSFVFTLTNMLHGRVPYPKDENRDKQPPKDTRRRPAKNKEAGPKTDGMG